MTVRLRDLHAPTAVLQGWQRRLNWMCAQHTERVPEPAQLYTLIGLALTLHGPLPRTGLCESCGLAWPCPQVRLAFRLREGF
ncbi:hypothetical protein [Amycolatopsis aidingensis]|uniref:hypothetical protein n=1 Tax=Amycolatopsis aidingensis TaxID=2842453 RepID=UPI001C0B68EE|nr:hypothetical protein [Amycolatopsis aidingensis]